MRVGFFGGSFDPIHSGHIRPVREVRARLGLERVIYLPTARPPHKPEGASAPAWGRFAMVELALLGEEGLFVSSFEMSGEVAYTVDTLRHFRRQMPGADPVLIVGGDSLAGFTTWREWQRIPQLAEVAVMVRPGWDVSEVPAELPEELRAAHDAGRLHFIANPPVAASSSELRRRLAAGESPEAEILPTLVLDYIRKYGLYRRNPA